MNNQGNFLTAETASGLMDVYVASPQTGDKYPVVIVLQEAFGVNHHIKDICHRLANEGFVAAAPELYHREGRHLTVEYGERKDFMPLMGKLTNKGILDDVRATINFLENLPKTDLSSVSCIGFCVGGFASTLCATKLRLNKMIAFYGAGIVHAREGIALTPLIDDLKLIKSKSLFFFGGQDASIPDDDVKQIEKKMTEAKVPFEVVIFPQSNHGFFCDERKSYDPEAAKVAWQKTLDFLKA